MRYLKSRNKTKHFNNLINSQAINNSLYLYDRIFCHIDRKKFYMKGYLQIFKIVELSLIGYEVIQGSLLATLMTSSLRKNYNIL